MIFEHIILIATLAWMVYFFLTERLPIDLTAMTALGLLLVLGLVTPEEAFSGFSSPTVITMMATFFITGALRRTGVATSMGQFLFSLSGNDERKVVLVVVLSAAVVSSVMNNVAATALMLPAVMFISSRSLVSPSKLLIPLSFGTILGGTLTLIGTSPNMLASDVLVQQGFRPFTFLEFFPFGILIVIAGTLYLTLWGRKILPKQNLNKEDGRQRNLPEVYRLRERLFTLFVPEGAALVGSTIASSHFGEELGANIDAVYRRGEYIRHPEADFVFEAKDILLVRGRVFEFEVINRLHGVIEIPFEEISESIDKLQVRKFRYTSPELLSLPNFIRSLQYHVVVGMVERDGKKIASELGDWIVKRNDIFSIIGTPETLDSISLDTRIKAEDKATQLGETFFDKIVSLKLPENSQLIGKDLQELDLGRLTAFVVLIIIRDGIPQIKELRNVELKKDDIIVLLTDRAHLKNLLVLSELEIRETNVLSDFLSKETNIIEVVLSPRSSLINRTLDEINFRERYRTQVLAIWREGNPIRARLAKLRLKFGDALLLESSLSRLLLFKNDPDFVVLTELPDSRVRAERAPSAIIALILIVVFSALHIFPAHVAAFFGAIGVLLFRAIKIEEAYKDIEWRLIMLVSALLPFGAAVQKYKLLDPILNLYLNYTQGLSPLLFVVGLCIFSSIISQLLDSTLAIILLLPLGLGASQKLGLDPHLVAMAITLSSSIVFMFPFSHRANLLVMGAGGYSARDYFKIGTILSVIMFVAIVALTGLLQKLLF